MLDAITTVVRCRVMRSNVAASLRTKPLYVPQVLLLIQERSQGICCCCVFWVGVVQFKPTVDDGPVDYMGINHWMGNKYRGAVGD